VAVVGGGILGLAVARELTRRRPGESVCVLEREDRLASHQTGHNSGVIHAGVYYKPGSLKAELCAAGARELYRLCEERQIAHARCGKLIVALRPAELLGLAELERRGRANGVAGLRRVEGREIEEVEPHCRGLAALHSPATGVVDFEAVTRELARETSERGGTVVTGCEVRAVRAGGSSVILEHSRGGTEAGHAVFCAGAWADRLAVLAGAGPDPRIVPFRGAYLRVAALAGAPAPALRGDRRASDLVRALIYPVPDVSLPFLGVHLTRQMSGELLIGPTALPAPARDGGALAGAARDGAWRDLRDTLTWPGSWRLARRWWRAGLAEMGHAIRPSTLGEAAARYVPELAGAELEPGFAGVRAQAVDRRGTLLDDFSFSVTGRALHVRNAPSPGATASLAIARHVVDRCAQTFAW